MQFFYVYGKNTGGNAGPNSAKEDVWKTDCQKKRICICRSTIKSCNCKFAQKSKKFADKKQYYDGKRRCGNTLFGSF